MKHYTKFKQPVRKTAARLTLAQIRLEKKRADRKAEIDTINPSRPIPDSLIWFAFISKPFKEHALAIDLEARTDAFSVISLKDTRPRRKATVRRPEPAQMPVLPGIVFSGFPRPPNWIAIEAMKGYAGRIEYSDGIPAVFRASEIIRWRDQNEHARRQINIKRLAKVGDSVVHKKYGTIDEIVSFQGPYVILKTMMLGQNVRVKLSDVELLEVA